MNRNLQQMVAEARDELKILKYRRPQDARDCDGCGRISIHAFSEGEWVCVACKELKVESMADAAYTYVPGEFDRELLKDAGRPHD